MSADIHSGPEHTLQSEAGYIDARPKANRSTKISCNARPLFEPPRLGAVVAELTSIADADETSRSIDSSAAPLPATGAPLKPAATV
jgi:hypothetical protein